MENITHYDTELEEFFIRFLISDNTMFARCLSILKEENFKGESNKRVVKFLVSYASDYAKLPALDQIEVVAKVKLEPIPDHSLHIDWFLSQFEIFSRHRQLERAILQSVDLLEEQKYGEVEKNIRAAVQVGLVKDLGTSYFDNPLERLNYVKNMRGAISTGWKAVDAKLAGGMNPGELTIYAGQSGAGKSLFLQNQAINWVMQGKNVVYITLELSEKLCAARLDAMTTGIATWEVLKDVDKTAINVVNFFRKYKGTLQLKQLKGGCNTNDLRAYIKELEIKTGRKIDAIAVDYLDLMMPNSAKINVSDQFIKDKFVSEELRNLAFELDVLLVTASQLNRSSYEEVEFNAANIAGGISKLNTADNLIGIFTSATMKEAGRYQLQFMKTRSSSGVGSKVELKFNPASLRIEDMSEVEASQMRQPSASVIDAIKRKDNAHQERVSQETIETATEAVNKVNSVRDLLARVQKR